MKITITRSFRQVKQLHQFEPIESVCEISEEYELDKPYNLNSAKGISKQLDEFCREEVGKTLALYFLPMKESVGKSKFEKEEKEINKEEAQLDFGGDAPETWEDIND